MKIYKNLFFKKNKPFSLVICLPITVLSIFVLFSATSVFDYVYSVVFLSGVLFLIGNALFSNIELRQEEVYIDLFLRKKEKIKFSDLKEARLQIVLFVAYINLYDKKEKIVVPQLSLFFNNVSELKEFIDRIKSKNPDFKDKIDWDTYAVKRLLL